MLAPGVIALQFWKPTLLPYLCWVSAFLAVTCGIIAHNHNHKPTFADKSDNRVFGNILSVFYGYPVFGWIPTHNLNHHRYVNRPGDATITWRLTRKHTFVVAITYFFVSSYYQATPIGEYISKAKEKAKTGNSELWDRIRMQYAVTFGGHAALLATAIALHGVKLGLVTWFFACGLPSGIALWSLMLFNYEQHVNMDPFSKYDHSRNFTSPVLNFLLFGNGYHAVHHDFPNMHWSEYAAEHKKIAHLMAPDTNQPTIWWYWFKQYALAPLVPAWGTKQVGPGPWTDKADLATASVDAVEAGNNAERLVNESGALVAAE